MELNKYFFITILLIVIVLTACNSKNIEGFSMISNIMNNIENPGQWIGRQVGSVWNSIEKPVTFVRNTTFDVVPNYTWVSRYYEKKNDWIRANKGMPPLKPSPTAAVVKMKIDNNNKNYGVSVGDYHQSISSLVT